jgi:two-component system OmpR family sensor kinase
VPLRRRLVVAVSAMGLIVVGAVVAVLVILRASLHAELDKQLYALTRERVGSTGETSTDAPRGTPTRLTDQCIRDPAASKAVSAATCSDSASGKLPQLAADVVETHATDQSAPFEPFDVAGENGHDFRVTAVRMADGRIVVTAVSTAHIDAIFQRVVVGSSAVGLGLLTAIALVAWWVERLGVRPVRAVAAAADAIASGDTGLRVDPQPSGTEAGHLARAFNVMVDQRQAAEDRLRRFVADASHELRTPLTTVAGVYELFRSGSLVGRDLDEAMNRAASEAGRMTRLVEDLLLLTHLDHGRPLASDDVDLAVLLRDAAGDVWLVQPGRPVAVESDEAALVSGDEARLRQVVGNLVGNAMTHTSPSTALRLTAHRCDDVCVLEVHDDGPGLTPAQAERVFDRFYRANAGRGRRTGGTGLGLSIVQSIVTAHRGQVSVDTTPGRGCTFRVVLPTAFQRTSRLLSGRDELPLTPSWHDTQPQSNQQPTRQHSTVG